MTETSELVEELANSLEQDLLQTFGPMIYGQVLYKSLGYTSADAFRQAVSRQSVPVDTFPIEGRRGKFALTRDIAKWIAIQKVENTQPVKKEVDDM
ncbi:hypothetical protein H4J57_09830 [Colwellia sp. BRX8-7]|jgi:hypothetical protein|uniref:hypothetical protein n=1 Tax=Colwellia sp. BRX8-7 TaxID=2759833 RepID=UPI0015F39141|nr:hypothetical protein [Colwellia sp. BRX8-7]MBA6337499.1 hypothetical protein [Colwellia sp. BRX8-7]